jgi:rhodanese-related sulfurtransferase
MNFINLDCEQMVNYQPDKGKVLDFDPELLEKLKSFLDNTKANWNYILPNELKADLSKNSDYFLLDTRKSEDYEKGHIAGAVNIFWLDLLKAKNLIKLPPFKKIVICCYVGHTASQVLVILRLLGFDVVVLKFGMGKSPVVGVPVAGWENYGFETVKSI